MIQIEKASSLLTSLFFVTPIESDPLDILVQIYSSDISPSKASYKSCIGQNCSPNCGEFNWVVFWYIYLVCKHMIHRSYIGQPSIACTLPYFCLAHHFSYVPFHYYYLTCQWVNGGLWAPHWLYLHLYSHIYWLMFFLSSKMFFGLLIGFKLV